MNDSTNNIASVSDWLFPFTSFETALKEWYEKHGELAPYDQIRKWPPELAEQYTDLNAERMSQSELSSTLNEKSMIDDLLDVSVLRHPRYFPAFTHDHQFVEIVYVMSGCCRQTIFVGEREEHISLVKGNFLIIAPAAKHSILVDDDSIVFNILLRKSTFDQAFFSNIPSNTILAEFFSRILYAGSAANYVLFRSGENAHIRDIVFRLIGEYSKNEIYKKEILNMYVSLLMMHLLRDHSDTTQFSEDYSSGIGYIPAIIQYIEKNYADTTVQRIADHFSFSLSHISRLFKSATGYTLSKVLIQFRLQKAETLLVNTLMPISEIADAAGFNDITNFIRRFKDRYQTTPAQFRKKHRSAK